MYFPFYKKNTKKYSSLYLSTESAPNIDDLATYGGRYM